MRRPDLEGLSTVVSILVDQIRLYSRAAELSKDAEAQSVIRQVAEERSIILADLRRTLVGLGHASDAHGTLLGATHKAFLDARALVDDDTHAALREVLRGEDYLRDQVHRLLNDTTLSETKAYLETLAGRIKAGHDAIAVLHAQIHK